MEGCGLGRGTVCAEMAAGSTAGAVSSSPSRMSPDCQLKWQVSLRQGGGRQGSRCGQGKGGLDQRREGTGSSRTVGALGASG